MCPICRQPGKTQSWSDDPFGLVESWDTCADCGYRRGFSYGVTEMVLAPRLWEFSHADTEHFKRRQEKLFKRAVRHARRVYVRGHRVRVETTNGQT